MTPSFDLQGGFTIAVARGLTVAALLSAFGTVVFRTIVAPKAFSSMTEDETTVTKRQLLILAQASVAAALCGIGVWLVAQSAIMADAGSLQDVLAALPKVFTQTLFGRVIGLQISALLILAVTLGCRDRPVRSRAALVIATVAVSLQAGHSHALSMEEGPSLLLGCDVLHLFGAGAWLGGLIPLLMVIRSASPKAGATAARWFSPLGQWCIAALVVSAAWQGWVLVGTIPGLIGTGYGWMVVAKLTLFGVLLGFAYYNRYHFAPALLRAAPGDARRILVRSMMLQTGCAVAIIGAAVVLSELPPAIHTQAVWLFAHRLSLAAITEDADFRWEAIEAGLALAGAATLILLAVAISRLRIAAIAAAGVIGWFAIPHLDLLLVPAYPTSFYRSPTGFTAASIVEGHARFAANCAACHGENGRGDGPDAKAIAVPPADLTAAHLWAHRDGELFWWISAGMFTPEGSRVMPGFAGVLDEDSRWNVIDYIRAHNAGYRRLRAEGWTQKVKGADFGLVCGDRPLRLSDFRGRFVRLVFGSPAPATVIAEEVSTILVSPRADAASQGACVTRDETVPRAYAILSGVISAAVAGMQILIDPNGWLRAEQQANAPATWNDPRTLAAEITELRKHKVETTNVADELMKMPM